MVQYGLHAEITINGFYKVSEVLRRIFEPRRDELTGEWR